MVSSISNFYYHIIKIKLKIIKIKMLYLFGIGIKNNITLARGLTNIYGIGLNESKIIIRSLGLSENIKVAST